MEIASRRWRKLLTRSGVGDKDGAETVTVVITVAGGQGVVVGKIEFCPDIAVTVSAALGALNESTVLDTGVASMETAVVVDSTEVVEAISATGDGEVVETATVVGTATSDDTVVPASGAAPAASFTVKSTHDS